MTAKELKEKECYKACIVRTWSKMHNSYLYAQGCYTDPPLYCAGERFAANLYALENIRKARAMRDGLNRHFRNFGKWKIVGVRSIKGFQSLPM